MAGKLPSGRRARKAAARKPSYAQWSKAFLLELAVSSNVSAAARQAGVSTSTVYDTRRTNPEFNRKWQIALCEGYDSLEFDLLHRLRSGEIKPVAGAKRGVRSYDNATAFRLLAAHRETVTRQRGVRSYEDRDAIIASINAKIDRIKQREQLALPPPRETDSDTNEQ